MVEWHNAQMQTTTSICRALRSLHFLLDHVHQVQLLVFFRNLTGSLVKPDDVPTRANQEVDGVLNRFEVLMKRAQVGRLRSKASGPRADEDTVRAWSRCADLALQDALRTTHRRFTGIIKACGTVGFFSNDLFSELIESVSEKGLRKFSPWQIGEIVKSLGIIAKQNLEVSRAHLKMTTLCTPFVRNLVETARVDRTLWHESFPIECLAEIMFGLGWLHRLTEYDLMVLSDKVHCEVVARAFLEKLKGGFVCSGASYALLFHGCANTGYNDVSVLAGLKESFADWTKDEHNRASLSESDLLKIVWSFSGNKLGKNSILLFLGSTIIEKASKMSSANLANLLFEICSTDEPDAQLMTSLLNIAMSALHLKAFKQRHIAKIIQGLGIAKYSNRDAFAIFGSEVTHKRRIFLFSMDELLMVLKGIEGAGVYDENHILSILERFHEKDLALSPTQMLELVSSLAGIKTRIELMHEDTKFVSKLMEFVSHLRPKVQSDIKTYPLNSCVEMIWSFGRLRFFDFNVMSDLIKHYHSCVAYRGQATCWESLGKVLSTYADSNMQNCLQPTFQTHRFFEWTNQWVILNAALACKPSDLIRVFWAMVRFSKSTPLVVIDRISSRIQELVGEGKHIGSQDWKYMVQVYLCVEYLHKLDLNHLPQACLNLFDLAKEHWRSSMKQTSSLHKGFLQNLPQYGVNYQTGVLVVENLFVVDVLIPFEGGKLAVLYDGKTGYHENRIEDDDYLSDYKHRMLMGYEFLRNEILETQGYNVALLPYYTSSRWKRGSLKRLLIDNGLIVDPDEVEGKEEQMNSLGDDSKS